MFIKQLSIFVENKLGRLEAIINTLGSKGVNIRALSIAETTEFGILRVIVDDIDTAKSALDEIGVISKATDVIAVYIDDKTGGLASILKLITDAGISVEYMYAFLSRKDNAKALMVLKADDEVKAEKTLLANGVELFDPKTL